MVSRHCVQWSRWGGIFGFWFENCENSNQKNSQPVRQPGMHNKQDWESKMHYLTGSSDLRLWKRPNQTCFTLTVDSKPPGDRFDSFLEEEWRLNWGPWSSGSTFSTVEQTSKSCVWLLFEGNWWWQGWGMCAKFGERNIEKMYCQSRELCSIKLSANWSTPLIGFHQELLRIFCCYFGLGFVVVVALFSWTCC